MNLSGNAQQDSAHGICRAGVSVVDLAPPAGLMMSGYAARTEPATGAHDALTVRAVVVDDTAIVVADVVGIHEDTSHRIRIACSLPADNVIVAATHTHGGPVSMAGRGGIGADAAFIARLEQACVEAIDRAAANRVVASFAAGNGANPGIAFNRRHDGGVIDPAVPVLHIRDTAGHSLAYIFSHACHPVVLGAANRLYTADYPHYARTAVEAELPGAVAIFLPGAMGDISTGHSPHSSISTQPTNDRSFAEAERLGNRIARAALDASLTPRAGKAQISNAEISLDFQRLEQEPLPVLAEQWRKQAGESDPAWAALYESWVGWAEHYDGKPLGQWNARISVLRWPGVTFVGLPGEIFAETALNIRARIDAPDETSFVMGFCEGTPGYILPAGEYQFGGYEVSEAHRYYGLPATFAAGSAEKLEDLACLLAGADTGRGSVRQLRSA